MRSENLATLAPEFYGPSLESYRLLLQDAGQLADLKNASTILSIGLDGRFGWSVVALELKHAVRRGAALTTIFPREHNLSRFAAQSLALDDLALADALQMLVRLTAGDGSALISAVSDPVGLAGSDITPEMAADLVSLARSLVEDSSPVIVLGPEYLASPASPQILAALASLARQTGATVLPLAPQSNLVGAFREVVDADRLSLPPSLDVLYLLGETPASTDPAAGFLIYQNFSSFTGSRQPDLSLPAAAFAEVDGTTFNLEGRTQQVNKAVEPPGEALPDWLILCRIAQKMGYQGFDYADVPAIQREMAQLTIVHPDPHIMSGADAENKTDDNHKNLRVIRTPLNPASSQDVYRGFPLTTWVEGLRMFEPGL